ESQNVLVVAAIGNQGPDNSQCPGNLPGVLSVGVCGPNDVVADFSSSQEFPRDQDPVVPSLVAPGIDVQSCALNNGYRRSSGTSMATCYIAGLAALLFEAKPDATAQEVRNAILGSCVRPEGMSPQRANRGIPNA